MECGQSHRKEPMQYGVWSMEALLCSVSRGIIPYVRPWDVAVLVPPTGIEVKSDNIRVRWTSNENHSLRHRTRHLIIVTMILFDGGWFMYHYTTCWYVTMRRNLAIVVVVVIIFIVVIYHFCGGDLWSVKCVCVWCDRGWVQTAIYTRGSQFHL